MQTVEEETHSKMQTVEEETHSKIANGWGRNPHSKMQTVEKETHSKLQTVEEETPQLDCKQLREEGWSMMSWEKER